MLGFAIVTMGQGEQGSLLRAFGYKAERGNSAPSTKPRRFGVTSRANRKVGRRFQQGPCDARGAEPDTPDRSPERQKRPTPATPRRAPAGVGRVPNTGGYSVCSMTWNRL